MSDDELWLELVRWEPLLTHWAYRISPQRVDDAKQELFLFAFVRMKQWWDPEKSAFSTALFRILQSNWILVQRKLNGLNTRGEGVRLCSENGFYDDISGRSHEQEIDAKIDLRTFYWCLPEEQRQLLDWKIEGLTLDEIGQRLGGISRERVRQKIDAAQKRIRKYYEWNYEG